MKYLLLFLLISCDTKTIEHSFYVKVDGEEIAVNSWGCFDENWKQLECKEYGIYIEERK